VKLKILLAKAGLDGHDRGVKVVARALRDSGMEVIYTGLFQSPETIVTAALQEDVDAVCLSILSGAHMTLFPRIRKLMDEAGLEHVLLSGGGIIPDDDMQELQKQGVGRLFGPGSPLEKIVTYFKEELPRRRALRAEV
jgi:methylmalonyl-CoA mutase C-terminal domain/subunit